MDSNANVVDMNGFQEIWMKNQEFVQNVKARTGINQENPRGNSCFSQSSSGVLHKFMILYNFSPKYLVA